MFKLWHEGGKNGKATLSLLDSAAMLASRKEKVRKFFRAQRTLLHWLGADIAPLGFYIPYRYANQVKAPGPEEAVGWLEKKLEESAGDFREFLRFTETFNPRFHEFTRAHPENVNQPRFDQEWFPGLDGAIAYAMVQKFRPRRIIEIGSGHSTRFLAQAVRDAGITTDLHSIDPEPRREIDAICSRITRRTVEGISLDEFRTLAAGDILFVDCSHIAMPGTDVDYLFTRVFPELRPGVVVHVHDIFLPYGYPREWAWRSYNEQNFLLALLSGGERFKILFPVVYALRKLAGDVARVHAPQENAALPSSFWLEVK